MSHNEQYIQTVTDFKLPFINHSDQVEPLLTICDKTLPNSINRKKDYGRILAKLLAEASCSNLLKSRKLRSDIYSAMQHNEEDEVLRQQESLSYTGDDPEHLHKHYRRENEHNVDGRCISGAEYDPAYSEAVFSSNDAADSRPNPFLRHSKITDSTECSSVSSARTSCEDVSKLCLSEQHLGSVVDKDALTHALKRIERLEEQLRLSQLEMLEKDQKCDSLIKLQTKVDNEVEELTGALFQEAYRMVHAAEERSQNAERLLTEARLKVDVLESEVLGLKRIVKDTSRNSARRQPPASTSTNSKSAILRFFNNSLSTRSADTSEATGSDVALVKRSTFFSSTLTSMPLKSAQHVMSRSTSCNDAVSHPSSFSTDGHEIDPIYYREFASWRENGLRFDENFVFLRRILREDVEPCLVFENEELSNQILSAVRENQLEIEPYVSSTSNDSAMSCYRFSECSLLGVRLPCPYRLRIPPDNKWHFISLLARNRIAAVCDFFTYIRYLNQGIVKPSTNDCYWCIVNLRKNMALAKLGFHFVLKMNGSATSPSDSLALSPQYTGGSKTPLSYNR